MVNVRCAEVMVPAPVGGLFTYWIPDDWNEPLEVGQWVVVPFGPRRHVLGVVASLRPKSDSERSLKHLSAQAPEAAVSGAAIRFWTWLSDYYLCHPGEVLMAALPSGFQLESRSRIRALPSANGERTEPRSALSPAAFELYTALLESGEVEVLKLEKERNSKIIRLLIKELLESGWAELDGFWNRKLPERKKHVVRRHPEADPRAWNAVLNSKRAPQQAAFLSWFEQNETPEGIDRSLVKAEWKSAVLHALIGKGLLRVDLEIAEAMRSATDEPAQLNTLNPAQHTAKAGIERGFSVGKTVLLHGVTASGKTEVYAHLIRAVLEKGQSALFLLPEIALTTQMIERMQRLFGDRVLAYHSRLGERERMECFRTVLKAEVPLLVLGARSAVLLPFAQLGLIVVDEEHETSYKQSDPAPRYHARDSALMLGRFQGCPVLLGSATPSLESMMLAQEGKYAYVPLRQRFNNQTLPQIELSRYRPKPGSEADPETALGPDLLSALQQSIDQGHQALLFQNRRGFSPYVQCSDCGSVPGCPHCDISLTLHRSSGRLRCHYCGYSEAYRQACTECGSMALHYRGFGTQRLEEELEERMPEWRTARIDLDSTRRKEALSELLEQFESGQLDVLIGTQMVTKGLDFQNVSIVGVVDADALMRQPDFRAEERSFQLLAQVAGRAGRGAAEGRVMIQTADPTHDLYKDLRDGDFDAIYRRLLYKRQLFRYPPYCRLIRVLLLHADPVRVDRAAQSLAPLFKSRFGMDVLGPEPPSVARLRGMHQRQFLLKIDRDRSPSAYKRGLTEILNQVGRRTEFKGIRVLIDVDP
ncbi:primosomal protein N' [bacterium]|nr:primosomal protein N' [bacterium]